MADGDVWVIGDPLITLSGASTPRPGSSLRQSGSPSLPKDVAVGERRRSGCRASSTTRSRGSIRGRPRITDTVPVGARRIRGRGGARRRLGREHPRRHGLPGRSGDGRGHGDDRRRRPPRRHRRRRRRGLDRLDERHADGWRRTPTKSRIGLITVCEGVLRLDLGAVRSQGAELPATPSRRDPRGREARRTGSQDASVAGKPVRLFLGCGDQTGETALCRDAAARRAGRRRRPDRPGVHRRGSRDQGVRARATRRHLRRDVSGAGAHARTTQCRTSSGSPPTGRSSWPASARMRTTSSAGASAVTVADDQSFDYTQVAGLRRRVLRARRDGRAGLGTARAAALAVLLCAVTAGHRRIRRRRVRPQRARLRERTTRPTGQPRRRGRRGDPLVEPRGDRESGGSVRRRRLRHERARCRGSGDARAAGVEPLRAGSSRRRSPTMRRSRRASFRSRTRTRWKRC